MTTPGMTKRLTMPWADAEAHVKEVLKTEGFGVLTRIDVEATLKEKLGVDFPRYLILGACNPAFAHRALSEDPAAGLMLPCNVTLSEAGPGEVVVRLVDPAQTLAPLLSPALAALAGEVREKLARVHARL